MSKELYDLVLAQDALAELDPAQRRLALRSIAREAGIENPGKAAAEVADAIDGWGPLTSLMEDRSITDVLVNGPHEVWVERDGRLVITNVHFRDVDDLLQLLGRLLGSAGVRCDASTPIADARLSDGSRLHVVLAPIADRGPMVSIRRFPGTRPNLDQLFAFGMFEQADREVLRAAVARRRSIVICGGTGSGKTTLLNALLGCVDPAERVIAIEETPELQPACKHFVRLTTRTANVEGKGAVDLPTLLRSALRMRPDRIIVGEVRGTEAMVALAAMSVGHEGSMVTVHASSASDALERFVFLARQGSSNLSEATLRSQFQRAFDLVVYLERSAKGTRLIAAIEELDG